MSALDYEARQAARKVACDALRATHKHLTPAGSNPLIAATKNIRTELKMAFPAVKFSIRSSRYSGGESIRVEWIDGPTRDQVESIVKRYQAGTLDGMTDCYNYEHSAWTDAFGDAKYVFATRQYSDKAVASCIRTAAARYNAEPPSVADFRSGALHSVTPLENTRGERHWAWTEIIYRELAKRTWALQA